MKSKIMWGIKKVLMVAIAFSLSTTVYASGFNHDVLNGTAVVYQEMNIDGVAYSSTGTAFFIGEKGKDPQYLVTNYHVVSGLESLEESANIFGEQISDKSPIMIMYDQNTYDEAFLIDYDEISDIAILRIGSPTQERDALSLTIPAQEHVGMPVYAVGYADISNSLNITSQYSKEDASVTSGNISRLATESETGRKIIELDVVIQSGNSGGPLVLASGSVVGVNSFGISDTEILNDGNVNSQTVDYAINIEEAMLLLNKNGIVYDIASQNFFLNNLVLITGIAVTLLIAIIVIIVTSKNKKNKVKMQELEKQAAELQLNLKQAQNQAQKHEKKHVQAFLTAVSPSIGVNRIVVPTSPIIIGRDAAVCSFVFSENAKGISSKHCSIYYDENSTDFVLCDLRSTYGTYFSNEQRLTEGVPYHLPAGSKFYLGDKNNVLKVEVE